MNRTEFFNEYKTFIKLAMRLAEKARSQGILSLEDETEDIDDENFKQGLRFVVDGIDPGIIDEIYTNVVNFEKDEYARQLKTIQKRTVQGLQQGDNPRLLFYVLNSYANLSPDEKKEIELGFFNDTPDDLDLDNK